MSNTTYHVTITFTRDRQPRIDEATFTDRIQAQQYFKKNLLTYLDLAHLEDWDTINSEAANEATFDLDHDLSFEAIKDGDYYLIGEIIEVKSDDVGKSYLVISEVYDEDNQDIEDLDRGGTRETETFTDYTSARKYYDELVSEWKEDERVLEEIAQNPEYKEDIISETCTANNSCHFIVSCTNVAAIEVYIELKVKTSEDTDDLLDDDDDDPFDLDWE